MIRCWTYMLSVMVAVFVSPPTADAQDDAQYAPYTSPAIPSQIEPLPPIRVAELPEHVQHEPVAPQPLFIEPFAEYSDGQFAPEYNQTTELPRLHGTRDGVFQKVTFTETWLPRGGGDGFGLHAFGTSATFGFPLPTRESPLVIRPSFNLHLLDGPDDRDVPPQVFDASVQFRWIKPLNDRWVFDIGLSPGYAADFDASGSDAVRVTGHGIAIWSRSETTKIILGVAYVDRGDIRVVPAAGVIYTPHENVSYELVFPRPRVAWRPHGCFSEHDWLYVAGEFGGGTWAIERASGEEDLLEYSDYRVVLGFERKTPFALQPLVELGYVFGRKLEFDSSSSKFRPDDTLMLRFGLVY